MPHQPRVATFRAAATDAGRRLDAAIPLHLPELSRSRAGQLIGAGLVTVGGKLAKASHRLQPGDEVAVALVPPDAPTAEPEDLPLRVIYQDAELIVVDKPRGMATHPATGTPSGTLVNALLGRGGALAPGGDALRPGIVHRLDKDTTGLLVVACSERAHRSLSVQLQARTMRRTYLAVVHGAPGQDTGTVDAPIARHPVERKRMAVVPGGRRAVTQWRVAERFPRFALLEVSLETGRTHQIRVHMRHIGHPVAGDPVYGPRQERLPAHLDAQALHAWRLQLEHPVTGASMTFTADPPEDFQKLLEVLRHGHG